MTPPPSPSSSAGPTGPAAIDGSISHNARLGLFLFFIYFALYAGFVVLATFNYQSMKQPVVMGVNLAIVYGFGLIVAAFVLAIVYMILCRAEAPAIKPEGDR